MKIAIVSEDFLPLVSGVVFRLLHHVEELIRAGDEVMVVCPATEQANSVDFPVCAVPSFKFTFYPEYRIGIPNRQMVECIQHFAPDIIHYMSPFAFGLRAYGKLASQVAAPSIFSFHTLYAEYARRYPLLKPLAGSLWWLTKELYARSDGIITVASSTQNALLDRGFRNVGIWPPAVDTICYHPAAASQEMRTKIMGNRMHETVLLTVSRLAREKNIEFMARVVSAIPGSCLAIVGEGPHRAYLEKTFAGMNVRFLGVLKGRALAEAYASADVFLFASETETLGNVVLEANASGLPVVAPNAGGVPSVIHHGVNGYLFRPGCTEEAIDLTRKAIAQRRSLGAVARERMRKLSWQSSTECVRNHYREIASQWNGKTPVASLNQRCAAATLSSLVHCFRGLAALVP